MNAPAEADSPSDVSDLDLYCPGCGYSLRGLESEHCPECGLKIDRTAAAVSRIPWEHRRRIGYVRAYRRTLLMSSKTVAGDIMRPVSYRDARLFQLVTVLITALPLAAMAALPLPPAFFKAMGNALSAWPMVMPPGYAIDIGLPLLAGVGLRVVLPVAIVLYLLAMTGVASYFFHPPHLSLVQQNRAIALSYYGCTPIVLLVLPALVGWAFLLLHVYRPDWEDNVVLLVGTMSIFMSVAPVAVLLLLWVGYVGMLRRSTQCGTARAIALAVTLPIAWVVLAALILVGLPWLAGFAMMVVWSFQ